MDIEFDYDVKICTPYYNLIEEETQQAIYDLLDSKTFNCAWKTVQGTNIANARNYLVNDGLSDRTYQELQSNFTHYLFIDSDVVVKERQIKQMMSYDLDVVSLAYKSREQSYSYVGGIYSKDDGGNFIDALKFKSDMAGLCEVDWVGGGCLLVKKEVFEHIKYPWFHYPVVHLDVDGIEHSKLIYEDIGFCMNVKDSGYKIYMDCDNEAKHLARNYNEPIVSDVDLLLRNVTDDMSKMFQLVRGMSYELAEIHKQNSNNGDK